MTPPNTSLSAAPDRLSDQAYAQLRKDVMNCLIRPGEEVTEAQLVASYGHGKAAIRSALMRLSQEGLVVALPRRGYQIAPVTLRDIRELFQLRALLEPEATRLGVAQVDVVLMRELDATLARGYVQGDADGEAAFLAANRAFHSTLIAASGNEKLTRILENVIDQMERLFHLGLARSWHKEKLRGEHRELVEAVEARDADRAAAIVAEHIETMRQSVIEGVMNSNDVAFSPSSLLPRFGQHPVTLK